jgi:periplasmic protein TonB
VDLEVDATVDERRARLMFDVYLDAKAIDPRSRVRMVASGFVAIGTCMVLAAMSWTGSKLGVSRVAAPSIESLLVVMESAPPPAPASLPPTPRHTSGGGVEQTRAVPTRPEDPVLEDDLGDPARPRVARSTGSGGGVPPGTAGPSGGPPCVVPPCGLGQIAGTGTGPAMPPVARRTSEPASRPIEAVRAQAIYSPDPAERELAVTPTGRSSRKSGKSTVRFCIDVQGKVGKVQTKHAFGGDPEVDAVCRRTVARWRFRPFMVGNRPHVTCSEVTFEIRFE